MEEKDNFCKNIQILVTTMDKTYDEMIELYNAMNIKEDCIIRSQCGIVDERTEIIDGRVVRLVLANDKGLSKNRNELLRLSSKKYVLFADDDEVFDNIFDSTISNILDVPSKASAFVFSVIHRGKIFYKFKRQRRVLFPDYSFGLLSFILNRKDILNHNLFFNELFGSGSKYNHGEDSIFIQQLFKTEKIYSIIFQKPLVAFRTSRQSTWFGGVTDVFIKNRSTLIGYLHPRLLYLYLFKMFFQYRLFKRGYRFFRIIKYAKEGKKMRKKKCGYSNNGSIYSF